ncbi:protein HUA2-LIKE 3-like [Impatiens glandulifera]|uniref:protein HUA2-LIKE 3-like n=1 Tax=Impatiens glandulifera TaxID=253017 RepID=UPI001FB15241|nr:protein HUA2-LIKE 3-like [Impatiens glandulifera]
MAPSRRKGCVRAAAAAAACRQWKVGDLVLAKVKGYPAWPATVSEPEKWGYSSDAKKVLVYFFGTQQIALCNPIDVEPFTEEMKETLLTKRHSKGADFVRAVHEIIDSYEQLKKEGEVSSNPVGNVTRKNSGSSGDNLGLQNRNEASNVALDLCAQTPLIVDGKELKVAVEDSVEIVKESDIFPDKVTITKDPKEKNQGNTYFSRKRFRGAQPNSCSSQKQVVTAPRSRFLSRVDVSKFEKCISNNDGKAATDVPASLLRDEIRSMRVWKSPNVADEKTNLHAMPLNGSSEDNGSEILTVDSEAISLNEGSTLDSGCNLQQSESVLEHCDAIELNQKSVLVEEAVIVKKKRKQNRKRATSDASDAAKVVEDTGSEVEAVRAGQHFPDERRSPLDKGDGDEHLPLVKRARVRLGRSSSIKEDLDISSPLEEKSSPLLNKVPGLVCTSMTPDVDCNVDTKTFLVKFNTSDPVLPNVCSQSSVDQLQVSDGRSSAKLGCPVYGEAALPPSKRLHRALEAMSANTAEDTKSEVSLTIKTYINKSISSRESPETSVGGKGVKCPATESFEFTNVNASQGINCTTIATSSELPEEEERANSPIEKLNCSKLVSMNSSQNNEFCEVRALENLESDELKSLPLSSLGESIIKVAVATTPKNILPSTGIQEDNRGCDEGSLEPLLPSKGRGQDENIDNHHKIQKSLSKPYTSHDLEVVSYPGSRDAEIGEKLPGEGDGSDMKPSNSPFIKKKEASQMFHVTGDIKQVPRDSDAITSPTTLKDIAASEFLQNLSGSTSISLDHTGERDISGQGSSSSMTNRLGSIACESPPSTSVCNDSTIENDRIDTGRCVLTSHIQYVKSKDINKRSSMTEPSAALTAFEAALVSLTRTKETIGRATRIAIDCAKYGNASKVVEIVARNLETEPSLHRRVDLFFLVDSIAQCSRGLKGEVGDTYPSVIQELLQRLLLAAAPPGSSALENRRQCLKVLRLWLERRILPEPIIRHHIRELESLCCSSSGSAFSRRSLRTERPFDDPIREMAGMLVDEYGSNSSLKLVGLYMPPMLKDVEEEGSDSDGDNFEAVTPEHECQSHEEKEIVLPMAEKHTRVLEEVDGELEMEDVAPSCDAETASISNAGLGPSNVLHQFDKPASLPFLPPLPVDMPPSSPPLPISPPPPLPPTGASLVPFDSNVYVDAHAIGQSMALVNPEVVPLRPSVPDPCNSGVFNSQPVPHHTVQPAIGIQENNETSLHNAAYPMRPPQPAPSNQFSYILLQSQREVPHPSYPGVVGGNFCNDFDRRNMGLHEHGGGGSNWRLPGPPPISGTYYPDCSGGGSYAPPYPPCDPSPQMPNSHGWGFPQWNTNHREFTPHRPPAEGPMSVAIRAPCFWQPR